MMTYLRLTLVATCPVLASVVLYILEQKTAPDKRDRRFNQIAYGIVFGALAVMGTEFGVPITGAVINARDAAPLCAGLIFGAPAGIIAGLIGGIERWFAVYWGAGSYTQLACSISTVIAGLFGAVLRKWMFDNKKPAWYYGFAAALVMEVLHMLMIFFTNMSDVQQAFTFVKLCSAPMILVNALSVMLAVLVVTLLGKEKAYMKKRHKRLSQSFSRWLLMVVLASFGITSVFTYILQTEFSINNNEELLCLNIEDIKADIEDASDANLLRLTHGVANDIDTAVDVDNALLYKISEKQGNDFSEINIVDKNGFITCSTTPENVGFDMSVGEQAQAFLKLLSDDIDELVQRYQPISRDGSYMKYAGVTLLGGGFVQVGYNAERFRKDIDAQVVGATRNRHVGENGSIIIAADDWSVVSNGVENDGRALDITDLRLSMEAVPESTHFEAVVYDTPCYCMYTVTEGYTIIAVESVAEAMFSRDLSVYVTVYMEILVFAALFVLVYFLTKKLVVENIHKINHTLSEITGGNLNVSVDVRTNEEFVSLSDDINSTVFTLKGYIAEAAARIDKELEVAKVIQESSLPNVFPPYPERDDFDIFATMNTAKEVGGDFYDFYLLDENKLAFLVADVSGKGITAAMYMMKAKTLLKDYAEKEKSVAQILTRANEALCEGNDAEMFVTCWMGILDFTTHIVSFANAGHNPPMVRHEGGSFEYIKSKPGFVLGGMEGMKYHEVTFPLNSGDEIYLYTDGVTEATDISNALYGEERLHHILNTLSGVSAAEICGAVKTDVDRFVGEMPQFDDMTMLHLKLLPKNSVTLVPTVESMSAAMNFVKESLIRSNVPIKIQTKMIIVVDEVYSNIIRYSDADMVEIECSVLNGRVILKFTDNGRPYNPLKQADPDITLDADEREIGGLGIFMVKKIMNKVEYQYLNSFNILTLTITFEDQNFLV